MRLIALEVPDDHAAIPAWLERHLAGLDLVALVAELEAVHGTGSAPGLTLGHVLGDHRGAVLDRGLAVLPPARLRQLLLQPRLLLDLQELVLVEGGTYWRRLGLPEGGHRALLERGRSQLTAFMEGNPGSGLARSRALSVERPLHWYRHPLFVSLATAAAVLAVVFVARRGVNPVEVAAAAPAWGWNRADALPQNLPPAAYLGRLADAAGDWFKKRPDEPVALARRIAEFRQGCSVLILAEHRPLAPEDRTWLVGKCRGWAARLDQHLADVEAGEDPLRARAEADETINKLITALRDRARNVA